MLEIKELRETIRRIALANIIQAENIIFGNSQGSIKFEYAVNLVIDEVKKLPLPIYIKIMLVVFQFAFKSEIRQEVQQVFNAVKDEINNINTPLASSAALTK